MYKIANENKNKNLNRNRTKALKTNNGTQFIEHRERAGESQQQQKISRIEL